MIEGDYLICKKDYFDKPNSNLITSLFKIPFFKKGEKYKINRINVCSMPSFSGLTYSTTTTTAAPNNSYSYKIYIIKDKGFIEGWLSNTFYTKKEEKNLKLKKLNNLC